MNDVPINVGAVIRSYMRKARVHKGFISSISSLVTKLLKNNRVEEDPIITSRCET